MHEKALMWCCSRLWHGLQTFELGAGGGSAERRIRWRLVTRSGAPGGSKRGRQDGAAASH